MLGRMFGRYHNILQEKRRRAVSCTRVAFQRRVSRRPTFMHPIRSPKRLIRCESWPCPGAQLQIDQPPRPPVPCPTDEADAARCAPCGFTRLGLARGLSLPLDDRINKTLPPVRAGQLGGRRLDLRPCLAVEVDPFDKCVEMHGSQPEPLC